MLCAVEASANRVKAIYERPDNAGRCNDEAVDQESCKEGQKEALTKGCISREEYEYAVAQNVIPTCWGKRLGAVCTCGCFAPEVRIAVINASNESQWLRIDKVAEHPNTYKLWTFTNYTSFSNLKPKKRSLKRITRGPELKPLVYVTAENGSVLGLTEEHAVLLSNGVMITAKSLEVGQELVGIDGIPKRIVAIERKAISGDVYNVLASGKSKLAHLISAEGLIVGDLAWQNSLSSELNSIVMRK
jgi:hypothetical protein